MNNARLTVLLWLVEGGTWTLSVMMLAVGVVMLLVNLLPTAQQNLRASQARLSTLQSSEAIAHASSALPSRPPASAPTGIEPFEAQLATTQQRSALLKQLWSDAAHLNVSVSKIDFQSEKDVAGHFDRLSITLPVKGAYGPIKTYVFGLMKAYPSLALDSIEFKREQVAQGDLEARLRFMLLSQQP